MSFEKYEQALGTSGWQHSSFDKYRKLLDEEEEFLRTPIQVVEGVNKCGNCGSTRTFCYAVQNRSSDEGTSSFITCVQCEAKWTSGS